MINSKIFERLDRSDTYFDNFDVRDTNLKKRVGYFEIENIDKDNIITIALNPKEYYERFIDSSYNKKQKGLNRSVPGMDFDSYSSRLSDLSEYFSEFLSAAKRNPPKRIEQKRFQVKNESMQMATVYKFNLANLTISYFIFPTVLHLYPMVIHLLKKLDNKRINFVTFTK